MDELENSYEWKVALITAGCKLQEDIKFSPDFEVKKIHLYSHSDEKSSQDIPDDILLPGDTIVRLRYKNNSPYELQNSSEGYRIHNTESGESIPVNFISPHLQSQEESFDSPEKICSFLGEDLLGVAPSNYCFYFKGNKQCRFCEILQTFKKEVEYKNSFKKLDIIEKSVVSALQGSSRFRYLAVTTGNIKSYDSTVEYFAQIGDRLKKHEVFKRVKQVLATLMPPQDLSKISLLKEAGFTKVYFPLEVFHPTHFQTVCPGKAEYGYDKILEALNIAVSLFGKGNVYTNFVYGIQSLNRELDPSSYDSELENQLAIEAVKSILEMSVIPAFTLYHYGGYNSIGKISLNLNKTSTFFKEWGKLVRDAKLVPEGEKAVLFSPLSLSNTLFNDGYRLATKKETTVWK